MSRTNYNMWWTFESIACSNTGIVRITRTIAHAEIYQTTLKQKNLNAHFKFHVEVYAGETKLSRTGETKLSRTTSKSYEKINAR